MGYSEDMKIGFHFLLNDSAKTSTRTKSEYHCANNNGCPSVESYRRDKFCGSCGQEIIAKEIPVESDFPSPYEFSEEHLNGSEVVASDNGNLPSNIWLYNHYLPEEILDFEISGDADDMFLDIGNLDIEEGIEIFSKIPDVVNFMSKFEEVYGKGSVKVIYGVVKTLY